MSQQPETPQTDDRAQLLEEVLLELSNSLRDSQLREAEQRVLLRRQAQAIRELRGQLAAVQDSTPEPAEPDTPEA